MLVFSSRHNIIKLLSKRRNPPEAGTHTSTIGAAARTPAPLLLSLRKTSTTPNSGGTSARGRLLHLGHLVPSADDPVPSFVLEDLTILATFLSSLPDLDLHTATDDAHSHGGEQVVSSIGMVVHAAVEHGSRVLANTGADHSFATRVIFDESRHVMNDTSDSDETTTVLSLLDVLVPLHDWKLLEWNAPVKLRALLIQLLLLLLHSSFLNLVCTELLEVVSESDLLHCPDEPLCRVVLPPFNGIAVVGRELVVEVVIAFAEGNESSDEVITGRIAVVKGLVAEPVSKRVDAEGGLLNEEDTKDPSVDEAAKPVVPQEASNAGREDESHNQNNGDI
jgi:hypothetical protein